MSRFVAGTCWHYGLNTDICGALVEAISGVPFAEFLSARLLTPLGMVDTGFWVPDAHIRSLRLADSHPAWLSGYKYILL